MSGTANGPMPAHASATIISSLLLVEEESVEIEFDTIADDVDCFI